MRELLPLRRQFAFVTLFTCFLIGLGVRHAFAQNNSPFQEVLDTQQQILAKLAALQQTVDALSAPDQTNTVTTSPVTFVTGTAFCRAANASEQARSVTVEYFRRDGTIIMEATQILPPQTSSSFSGFAPGVYAGPFHCKFTVNDGTKADIRASANIALAVNAGEEVIVPAN